MGAIQMPAAIIFNNWIKLQIPPLAGLKILPLARLPIPPMSVKKVSQQTTEKCAL
jgi:hypothetical protein